MIGHWEARWNDCPCWITLESDGTWGSVLGYGDGGAGNLYAGTWYIDGDVLSVEERLVDDRYGEEGSLISWRFRLRAGPRHRRLFRAVGVGPTFELLRRTRPRAVHGPSR